MIYLQLAAVVICVWTGGGLAVIFCFFNDNCSRRDGYIKALLAGPVFWLVAVWGVVKERFWNWIG